MKEKEEKKTILSLITWNYTAEVKLLVTALLILCTIATLFQFFPSRFAISTSDLRVCITRLSNSTTPPPPETTPPPPPPPPDVKGVVKRVFKPTGAVAYNFISMGAYRGGDNIFTVVGISSKPLHVYGNPSYQCQWISNGNPNMINVTSNVANKILPDWGYGRMYTVVVVTCEFSVPVVNTDNSGGKLVLLATTNGGGDTNYNVTDVIQVMEELPDSVDFTVFSNANANPKYDYLYCGSSLYGNLSPQRVREWIAYHVKLFGEKSHFVIHDAGGIHQEVMEVLKPWIELGYVTLQDIRDQERFDGYYHNQFMIVNDCLHRYKFMAKWMFFFDVDEFIYVPKGTLKSVVDSLQDFNQFTIEQRPMNGKTCVLSDYGKAHRKWGIEKLLYKDVKRGIRKDRKYAIQPRAASACGVHMSQNVRGRTTHKTEDKISYYHYHGTIAERREPCRKYMNSTTTTTFYEDKTPYTLDTTLRGVALSVKKFEHKMIGDRLQNTRQ
ncbi:hypothetical protein ACFE04_030340 [Oxalis oulophora]